MMANTWVVGIDLGGTKIDLGLVDPQNRVIARQRMPTEPERGPQDVVERIAAGLAGLQAAVPAGEAVKAIGICTPGPVDHLNGRLLDPPNIPGLHHSPLRQLLSERLDLPVSLEHDAKAAALGDFYFGAGQGVSSMVYIVAGTGVGAAIIVNGELYRGEHNYAGEVGHITVDLHGERCGCGSIGCVETYLGGPWLVRRYQMALAEAGEGPLPRGTISGEWVARRAGEGHALAREVMDQAGRALGAAVASLAMLFNIDLYIIGGSVANAGDLLLEPARQAVPDYSYASVNANIRILPTALPTDGPILGCSWLARQLLG